MKKIITLFWLIAVTTTLQAQKAQMLFYGVVEEGILTDPNSDDALSNKKQKNRPLSQVTVHVYAGGELLSSSESKESGFYGVLLKSGGNYEVVFEKNGYFSKTYSMNCRNLLHPADGSALKCPGFNFAEACIHPRASEYMAGLQGREPPKRTSVLARHCY